MTDKYKLGTNILDVQVPPQLRIRRSVGIQWLNQALGGGGAIPSTVGMVTGRPGYGKSTLVRQLADSITGEGHIALYNTGEESLEQAKMRVEEMGLTHGFKCGTETYIGKLLAFARKLQEENPKKQIFILQDSLQKLNDGYYKDGGMTAMTAVRVCQELTAWAKETYGIVLFVGQVTKDGVFAGKNQIKHEVDLHLELLLDEDRESSTRGCKVLTVSKNRFGPDGLSFPYVLTKKGLFIQEEDTIELEPEEDSGAAEPGPKRTVSGVMPKVSAGTHKETGT